MIVFSVFYPTTAGARFDAAYYESNGVKVFHGLSAGDGGPAPFVAMAYLSFESADTLQGSLTGPRAAEVFGDIANFTTIQPLTQVSNQRCG
ncbi:MAG: EthD family reductase [Gallionella sp.]|nr:EthD family reductase [Gallionella sp.]